MKDPDSKMLLLTDEEHAFLLELLLDYGRHAGAKPVRNRLAHKLMQPQQVRDVSWPEARALRRRARALRQMIGPAGTPS
jgi:hypothetical protein